jgi:carboxypeptidase T
MRLALLILGLVSFSAYSAPEKFLLRSTLGPRLDKVFKSNEFDITGINWKKKQVDLLVTKEEYEKLKTLVPSIEPKYFVPQSLLRGPDEEYKNPSEIEAFLKDIHKRFPSITQLVEVGKSLQGRSIWAIKISDNASTHEANEPVTLFNSMHHAREVMTPEITIDIVEYLTTNYESDEKVQHWVDSNQIWVIPMFNVDGNNIMWNEDSMWRKNARGGYGVDLNRNYPQGWNSCNGSSSQQWSQTYRGTAPASEPETQAMMKFVSKIKPVFDISYHSYSELVIYPYGCEPMHAETKEVVESVGKGIASKINYEPGTAWELLYNADGGDIDWMYKAEQVIPFVIEVNSTGEGFHPDYHEWRDVTVERNRSGWQFLLDRLDSSGVRGMVSNKSISKVEVLSGNKKVMMNYKINPDGSFHIILNAGNYILNFKNESGVLASKEITVKNSRIDLDIF